LLLSFLLFGLATAQAKPEANGLKLLKSDDQGVIIELRLSGFQVEDRIHEGVTYQALTISDLGQSSEVGSPQVPFKGVLLGIPSSGEPQVEILESEHKFFSGYNLYPAPRLVVEERAGTRYLDHEFAIDQAVYSSNTFYPGHLAQIGFSGYMRDQRVAQLQIYPIQYNPATQALKFYTRVRVSVDYGSGAEESGGKGRGGGAYERLLQNTLLNYESLERDAQPQSSKRHDLHPAPQPRVRGQQPQIKIFVTKDGLYQVTYADLLDAGLDLAGIDPRTIKMTNRGAEIPIHVHGQEIEFYGTAMSGIFTSRNVYWLSAGEANGLRMTERDGTPSGSDSIPASFYTTLHLEEDNTYWQNIPNGAGQDHWFWRKIAAPAAKDVTIALKDIASTTEDCTVRVLLKGKTDDLSIDPDHHTRIHLNGTQIDEAWWDGQIEYQHQATVPQSYLSDGANTLTIESLGDTGAEVDSIYLNWLELGYWDTYVAEDDQPEFLGQGMGTLQFEIAGFTQGDVEIFDISDPVNVSRIVSNSVELVGTTYTTRFEDTIQEERRYIALTFAQRKNPAGLVLDTPSDLKSTANGADYIIITHEDLYESILPLASYRESQGLRTKTVEVTDIYDEFSHGIFDPQAIRDFLSYAYRNWLPPAPSCVLLVGDANLDYKDNFHTGNINYVPTHLYETWELGETPNDNWFVCVSGDDILPDMFIGRISVKTRSDVEIVVNKIIDYEQAPPPGEWNRNLLFVADDDIPSFESISEELIDLLPSGYDPSRVYVSDYSISDDPTSDIISHINSGGVIANYVGHGNVDVWGSWEGGRIFESADIASLNNGGKLPFVTTMTCLNGFFPHPEDDFSLAEEFLRAENRGAIAVWSPTGLGYPSGHRVLVKELFKAIFTNDDRVLGSATTQAKIATYTQGSGWGDLLETFVLFGDPATEIGLPSNVFEVYLPIIVRNR